MVTSTTANFVVAQDGGNYVSIGKDGSLVQESGSSKFTNVRDAVQATLDQFAQPGNVYVQAGDHPLPVDNNQQIRSMNVHGFTNLILDQAARLIVPNGAGGSVFNFLADDGNNLGVENSILSGGQLIELSTVAKPAKGNWTALLLDATNTRGGGLWFNKIRDTLVRNANVGIEIKLGDGSGFITSNTFEFLRLYACRTFVHFDLAASQVVQQGNTPIFGNFFSNIFCQCQVLKNDPAHPPVISNNGIVNVAGEKNTFLEVDVWDIQRANAGAKSLEITNRALNTFVMGGIYVVLDNQSKTTTILGPTV